jgi:valyl-tRNA synthetase
MGLRLLHPIMPFVTEELHHRLPGHHTLPVDMDAAANKDADGKRTEPNYECGSVMVMDYPDAALVGAWHQPAVEATMATANEIAAACRSLRASVGIVKARVPAFFVAADAAVRESLTESTKDIATLAQLGDVTLSADDSAVPEGCVFEALAGGTIGVHLLVKDHIDFITEMNKLQKKLAQREAAVANSIAVMAAPNFQTQVKEVVKVKTAATLKSAQDDVAMLSDQMVGSRVVCFGVCVHCRRHHFLGCAFDSKQTLTNHLFQLCNSSTTVCSPSS